MSGPVSDERRGLGTKYCKFCKTEHSLDPALWASNGQCKLQKKESDARSFQKHKAKRLDSCHKYYEANRERIIATTTAWAKRNPEKKAQIHKDWVEANREWHTAQQRKWNQANKEKKRGYKAARRAQKLNATPAWADMKAIQDFYNNCPPGHEVDHVFPLVSKVCCGLHVLNNLQYLPSLENKSKGNRMPKGLKA